MMIVYLTYSCCEVTAVIRIEDSRELTRNTEDFHFIVVSTTQSLTTALLPVSWTIYSQLDNYKLMYRYHIEVNSIFRTCRSCIPWPVVISFC